MTATGRGVGRPPIGPPVKTRVDPDTAAALRAEADRRDVPLAQVLREVIDRGLRAEPRDNERTG